MSQSCDEGRALYVYKLTVSPGSQYLNGPIEEAGIVQRNILLDR